MQIMSPLGEKRLISADIYKIEAGSAMQKGVIGARWWSSVNLSRTAGESGTLVWDSIQQDNANMCRPATSYTKIWIPQNGWYLANVFIMSTTGPVGKWALQIHSSRLAGFFAYATEDIPAATTTYPQFLTATGVEYLYAGDSVYCYWASTVAVTLNMGAANRCGFGVWMIGK